ncbi:MAG: bifunctional fucokinase/L-fucose-1-P-guanylyltransferase [Lachnospiraceae bacterium]|nr:bifunctional fucokinase/L-fucose-1-P-guanylyltransferase [Lachnospiraceae bacterium]
MTDYTTLFEQQSYNDALENYQLVLAGKSAVWDYIILTASNEAQARAYEEQIAYRRQIHQLPETTHFAVLPDPDGKRVGSGGATLNALLYVCRREALTGKRILVIHSGGDSKRIPQYSACGKLFSPVPRLLPDGRRSTLFDEFLIGMSTVAPRISEGMLVCSGDVLLLFNALQIDFYSRGAAALSIKEDVKTGKNHGVYTRDEDGNVGHFLHKQSEERLRELGAVDASGKVDIDTGAVILDRELLTTLYELVKDCPEKYINEEARLSFYADFLYPLASGSSREQFFIEKPEGDFTPQLHACRAALWEALHPFRIRLIRMSPASFIHFGTTQELLRMMTVDLAKYRFLGWSGNVNSNAANTSYAVSNSYISRRASVAKDSYIEDCYIHHGSTVGRNCILSGVTLNGETVPNGTVLHGLKLEDGRFAVRMYGIGDNPKENRLFGEELGQPLWTAPVCPVCDTIEEAVTKALSRTPAAEMTSLCDSFRRADVTAILPWQEKLLDKVRAESILQAIDDGIWVEKVHVKVTPRIERYLIHEADRMDENISEQFSRKIRIYYYLSRLVPDSDARERLTGKCFGTISTSVLNAAIEGTRYLPDLSFKKDEVVTRLPVRVNWGGGWSDTPPYCMEHGGTVLNAALSFDGRLPIEVTLKKISEPKIILTSTDIGSYREFTDVKELQDCRNPHDAFALHKAALIVCGLIPLQEEIPVEEICGRLGGGLYFNTRVIDIPKGSGLGTSSILAGACVKGLYEILGMETSQNELYNRVLCMEQLMSTGGGWQDQVGGLAPGVKMVTSRVGLKQEIECMPLKISDETLEELNERFCLIYTGQRRLARNLLREVTGRYIGNNPDSLSSLYDIQRSAVLMRFELEKGNVDGFARLLSEHWEFSKKLDAGCTNLCIDQILLSIDDLIAGKMICGAGGGGFLQVLLRKGVSKDTLRERLRNVFQDSGVSVWDSRIEKGAITA